MKQDMTAAIILAAGLGTRMKSNKAKVLHEVLGRPMIHYVVETAAQIAGGNVVVVVGHQADRVQAAVSGVADVHFALQAEQLGTGHAVGCALPHVSRNCRDIIILNGDVPLISIATIQRLVADHRDHQRDVTVLGVIVDNPQGYGRLLIDTDHQVTGIVEEADATPPQKQIKRINSGIYCVDARFLAAAIPKLRTDNRQSELYLTDIIKIGYLAGKRVGAVISRNADEVHGINSRQDLVAVEALLKQRVDNKP